MQRKKNENLQDTGLDLEQVTKWCTNILINKATLEEWRENFRMSEVSFDMLCEKLRPYLTKQTTKLRNPMSVVTQVSVILYYLTDLTEKYQTHLV